MKAIVLGLCFALSFVSLAQGRGGGGHGGHSYGGSHSVRGYVNSKGTYVAPHRATNPNGSRLDNWSTKDNINPYTGKAGTKSPY